MPPPCLRPLLLCLAIALTSGACAPTAAKAVAASGATVGVIADAPFRIEVPAGWKGDLVVYLHGYEPQGTPREPELAQDDLDRWLLSMGYAVARSANSSQGWAITEALADTERLRQRVVALHGAPRRTFLMGHSMGGHLALATLERHGEAYDGALALCGANAPADEMFGDGVLPPLVAFDHFFPGALGLAAGGLADPASPPMVDGEALETALKANAPQAQALAKRFQILREDFAGALFIRYLVLRELTARAGGFPVDNRDVAYAGYGDDRAFNAAVRRYAGDPAAMAYTRANAPLAGTATKPVVLLSNNDDPTVPADISARYAALAAAAGNGGRVLMLPSQGKGHCAFTPEQMGAGLEALTTWVSTGRKPAP